LEHETMKTSVIAIRGVIAASLLTIGVTIGIASAAAQPDYSGLPVHPNEATDSSAFAAAAPILNPDGQPGVSTAFTHRDGSRQITTTILVLDNPGAATAAADQSRAELANQVVDSKTEPAAVGSAGMTVSGLSADRTRSVTVLTFTEGDAATTVEFEGPANDPVPLDIVTEYGQRQDAAIRGALS
jgi:hypothetical protein